MHAWLIREARHRAAWTCLALCLLALAAAPAAAAQGVRHVDVPRKYALDLASASPVAHGAGDVRFDGDSVRDRRGIASLPASEAPFTAVQTTSTTALPLEAGAGYLVNDRSGRTWVLRVAAADAGTVKVTVGPSAAALQWRKPVPAAAPG